MEEDKSQQSEGSEIVIDEMVVEPSDEQKVGSEKPTKLKKPKKPINKKQLAVFTAVVLVVALSVAAGLYFGLGLGETSNSNFDPNVTATQKKAEVKVSKTPLEQQLERFIKPTTGETWLSAPKKVGDLGYTAPIEGETSKPTYYEIGSHAGNTIYLSSQKYGPGESNYLFEKSPEGKVSAIVRPDSFYANYDNPELHTDPAPNSFKKGVAIDNTTKYDSISLPGSLDIGSGQKVLKPTDYEVGLGSLTNNYDSKNLPVGSTVKQLGGSTLLKETTTYSDTKLSAIGYIVKLPIGTTVGLYYNPIDSSLKQYQWDSGSSPKDDSIYPVARGCSQNPSSITRSDVLSESDVSKIGKTGDGQVIYQLKDVNSTLASKAYNEFKDFIKQNNDTTNKYAKISKEDFVHKEHGVVVYQDAFGQWLVYVRSQLMLAGGCAKPVVYLYPTKTQSVDVQVGAKVTVSDPYYKQSTGWQNVLAKPNGSLIYQGKSYDSLFWEGYGYGRYPGISSGTVVKSKDAPKVIKQQLAQLGLNAKETKDFLDYWQTKLPSEKYTVMSWITTADMNNLAPLYISPKPDTLIRVFLDFWGSNTLVSLPKQQLTTTERKGFTVVEWGGLTNGILK